MIKARSSSFRFASFGLLIGFTLLISCVSAQPNNAGSIKPLSDIRLVLTSIAPIFKLTQTLLDGTNVTLENIPTRPRSLAAQGTFFSRQGERYSEQFNNADAVITIGKIWPLDSFYTTAREANIRIVNIDASKPWSHARAGVSNSVSPVTGEISPYFWLSPANSIRILSIISFDLQALYPDQSTIIASNLAKQKELQIQLKADFEKKFIEVLDPYVYALADEFTYLTSELGIFVDGYFIKQDIDWKTEDLDRLTDHLQQSGITVVIHKWEPSSLIRKAVEDAGAQLVVLDLVETSTESFNSNLEKNLTLLLDALTQ